MPAIVEKYTASRFQHTLCFLDFWRRAYALFASFTYYDIFIESITFQLQITGFYFADCDIKDDSYCQRVGKRHIVRE